VYSFYIADDHGFPVQRWADQNDIDLQEREGIAKAKRAILARRAADFTSRSIFEFVMDTPDGDGASK